MKLTVKNFGPIREARNVEINLGKLIWDTHKFVLWKERGRVSIIPSFMGVLKFPANYYLIEHYKLTGYNSPNLGHDVRL